MSLDAMNQALEALEMVTVDVKTTPNAYEAQRRAITALRAAIKQPRQWQRLTEQEIKDCEKQAMVNGALPFEQRSFFARAIEAKLKEKNNG